MKIKSASEQMRELFTQMAHDIQTICDEYADDRGIPTSTIDEYLNTDSDV